MDSVSKALFDALIAELRAERGASRLTYDELERRTGLGKRSIIRYLSGERDIPLSGLFELAEAMNVGVDDLLERAKIRADQAPRLRDVGGQSEYGLAAHDNPNFEREQEDYNQEP